MTLQKSYTGITRELFNAIDRRAQQLSGMTLTGDTGTASADGVTIQWAYDESNQSLVLTLLKKPFFLSVGSIMSHFDDLVHGATI